MMDVYGKITQKKAEKNEDVG